MITQVNMSEVTTLLKTLIEERTQGKELEWIDRQEDNLRNNFRVGSFYLLFSSASRFIGKRGLELHREQVSKAAQISEGFQPEYWNFLELVRIYFLLMLPHEDEVTYNQNLVRLFETADMYEQQTLYKALPLLPFPEMMIKRVTEGIRTNITDVFDAIALNNPYPCQFLDQDSWNQMLLKAVFMQRPLYRIYGADERANAELRAMLIDFAHERWAANRKVMPELWRFVAPFMKATHIPDIERVIQGEQLERYAGLLACFQSELPEAQELLCQFPEIKEEIVNKRLNWRTIGEEAYDSE